MGSINIHMRHFPENDPRKLDNAQEREDIDRQVQEFLAKGGKITQCDSSDMQKIPAHQTWEQAKEYKRKSYNYGSGKKFKKNS